MIEEWRAVKGYEGLYEVSNLGRVKSLPKKAGQSNRKEKILKSQLQQGYLLVHLCKNGNAKYKTVHRLVAESFIPNTNDKPQINHIDGNKQNNNVNNLEWCTNSENAIHAFKLGLRKATYFPNGIRGELHPKSKPVMCIETGETFANAREAGEKLNINYSHISDCCLGKNRNRCGGYHWRYVQ